MHKSKSRPQILVFIMVITVPWEKGQTDIKVWKNIEQTPEFYDFKLLVSYDLNLCIMFFETLCVSQLNK